MSIRKVVGVFALFVLVGSLIVHLLTYSRVNVVESDATLWVLLAGVVASFAYALLTMNLTLGPRPGLMAILKQMPK